MRKFLAICLAAAISFTSLSSTNVFATSASRSVTAFNGKLTSNVWIQSIADMDGTGEFQVSAYYSGTNPSRANWIRTAWQFYVTGIGAGVSFSGISANISGSGSSPSGSWTNYNNYTASFRGRAAATGLAIYVGLTNTATMYALGKTYSTLAKV